MRCRAEPLRRLAPLAALALAGLMACSGSFGDARQRLSVRGSDTMVILLQTWAERYMAEHPGTTVQVTGGGSGTGIAALINGTTDIAAASRPITDRERRYVRRNRSAEVVEVQVALDAVAVYVHDDNPVAALSLEQLRGIFRGRIRDWSEVGGAPGRIVLYSRENNSGTYAYFKEHVLDGLDFASEAQTLPGTAAVINAVSRDARGIGYGGIGYGGGVRTVSLSDEGTAAVAPTSENAVDGSYPLARSLYLYTAGPPEGVSEELIDWIRSPEGQQLVRDVGFYPLPSDSLAADRSAASSFRIFSRETRRERRRRGRFPEPRAEGALSSSPQSPRLPIIFRLIRAPEGRG